MDNISPKLAVILETFFNLSQPFFVLERLPAKRDSLETDALLPTASEFLSGESAEHGSYSFADSVKPKNCVELIDCKYLNRVAASLIGVAVPSTPFKEFSINIGDIFRGSETLGAIINSLLSDEGRVPRDYSKLRGSISSAANSFSNFNSFFSSISGSIFNKEYGYLHFKGMPFVFANGAYEGGDTAKVNNSSDNEYVHNDHKMLVGILVTELVPENQSTANLHSQRLETLGMLAGGVAHDFNNLLTGILGHITYLKTILPNKGLHIESLEAIEHGAKRSSSLTQQILNFARNDSGEEVVLLDFADVIVRTTKLLKGALSPLYSVSYHVPKEGLFIKGVESHLVQVVANLLMNAKDALGEQGDIKIELGRVTSEDDSGQLPPVVQRNRGRFVRLSVTDNGKGMSLAVQRRVFDPFFSTKQGKGTGLGLTTVASVVGSMGGAITLDSIVGHGTNVAIYLPVQEEADSLKSNLEIEILGGQGKVLVIDDEELVRSVLLVSLQHLGYEVACAPSGNEALAILRSRGDEKLNECPFDLVILDMVMPVVSGEVVFRQIRELFHEVPILLISGMWAPESVDELLKEPFTGFMKKPFTIQDLSRTVAHCLSRGQVSRSYA